MSEHDVSPEADNENLGAVVENIRRLEDLNALGNLIKNLPDAGHGILETAFSKTTGSKK